MWFPYSLPISWKIECDRARAHDALADEQEREFLIGIQLRNPVSREWSVELQLQEPRWESHHDHSGDIIKVGYFPDENERLSEVACKLKDTNIRSAVDRSYKLVSDMLNYWSARYGRGFSIGGLRIGDLKHDARWRILPHWPSAQSFELASIAALPESLLAAANLYREGRTSTSDRYRFLCCEAILNKWKHGEAPFDHRMPREQAQDHESSSMDLEPQVTQELMVISGMHGIMPDLEGIKLSELPDRLEAWHEAAVDYVLNGNIEIESQTGIDRVSEWAAVANLLDLAAHQILSQEIDECTRNQGKISDQEYTEANAS